MKNVRRFITPFTFAFVILFICAAGLRWWQLGKYPAGFHQDELWFAYNAMLLKDQGTNMYGEKWPLTVDMWGDHVSAVHSYVTIPFYWLLGVNEFTFRSVTVFFSLATLLMGSVLIWQLTQRKMVVLLFAFLFSFSPWNIVMARASSTVIIDTFVLVCVLSWWILFLRRTVQQKVFRFFHWQVLGGIFITYGLSIAAYFTYFTSRLLIPPFLLGIALLVIYESRKYWRRVVVLAAIAVGLYLVFPFFTFLRTPYALGRFQETTIINSQTVQGRLFQYIARSGQAGLPPWLTRLLYNKVTVNAEAIAQQTIGLLSPSTLLFQTSPPMRYQVPGGAAVSYVEYFALLACFGVVLFQAQKKKGKLPLAAALCLGFTILAVIPSALTEDDFPNLQRAVMMTPFLQMAAAVGLWTVWQEWLPVLPAWLRKKYTLGIIVLLLSTPTIVSFVFGYFTQAQYEQPHFRGRAAEELARWINTNAHDEPMIVEHVEAAFLYPYFYQQENILQFDIQKTGKYFLSNEQFSIGQRMFVKNLCTQLDRYQTQYRYVVLYTFGKKDCRIDQKLFSLVYEAKYDDGNVGFAVYERLPVSGLALE